MSMAPVTHAVFASVRHVLHTASQSFHGLHELLAYYCKVRLHPKLPLLQQIPAPPADAPPADPAYVEIDPDSEA